MALTFVQRAEATQTGSFTAKTSTPFGSAVTNGNLLAVLIQAQTAGAALSSITDSVGGGLNTYVVTAGSPVHLGSNYQYIAYAKNVTGGSSFTVTVTFASSSTYFCFAVYEISGADTTAPFVTEQQASGNSTSIATASLSLSGNAIICAVMEADSQSITGGTGYTKASADANGYIADEYHIVSGSEAATASCNSGPWQIIAAAFKEASGAGGGTRGLFMTPPLSGLGGGGSFFRDPLQAKETLWVRRNHIYVPERYADAA